MSILRKTTTFSAAALMLCMVNSARAQSQNVVQGPFKAIYALPQGDLNDDEAKRDIFIRELNSFNNQYVERRITNDGRCASETLVGTQPSVSEDGQKAVCIGSEFVQSVDGKQVTIKYPLIVTDLNTGIVLATIPYRAPYAFDQAGHAHLSTTVFDHLEGPPNVVWVGNNRIIADGASNPDDGQSFAYDLLNAQEQQKFAGTEQGSAGIRSTYSPTVSTAFFDPWTIVTSEDKTMPIYTNNHVMWLSDAPHFDQDHASARINVDNSYVPYINHGKNFNLLRAVWTDDNSLALLIQDIISKEAKLVLAKYSAKYDELPFSVTSVSIPHSPEAEVGMYIGSDGAPIVADEIHSKTGITLRTAYKASVSETGLGPIAKLSPTDAIDPTQQAQGFIANSPALKTLMATEDGSRATLWCARGCRYAYGSHHIKPILVGDGPAP